MTTKTDYDVVIVGAGLTGLQAGISFASDGTKVLIVDKKGVGGQAGESSLIRNLLGFKNGVSGKELAEAGLSQAYDFGAEFRVPFEVQRIIPYTDGTFTVVADNHERISCKSVLLATGVQYRPLPARNCSLFVNRGVNYGSPSLEPARWQGKRVGVVGGANSAAQAAWYLAERCAPCKVHMLVRGAQVNEQMSEYMAGDIMSSPNIQIQLETEIQEVFGDSEGFKGVMLQKKGSTELERLELDQLFILIGATPHTAWVDGQVALDERGFIYTDRDIPKGVWTQERLPHTHETSVPGVFAAGDVEWGSVKRASSAIGAGSSVTPNIRRYLAEQRQRQLAASKTVV